MATFLVTGITGFVGGLVATRLAARGHRLRALVRTDLDRLRAAELGAAELPATLAEPSRLAEAAARSDGVVHCAASDAPDFAAVNHVAVTAMLGALRPGAAFVAQAGTLGFGPTPNGPPGEDGRASYAPPLPLAARTATDAAIRAAGAARDLRTAVVHAAFVHGGPGAVLPGAMAAAACETSLSAWPGDGRARWSAVHVEDWAELDVAAALRAPAGGRAYVAGGRDWSVAEIATALGRVLGIPAGPVSPSEAAERWGFLGPALVVPQVFDNRIAREELGWPGPRDTPPETFFSPVGRRGPGLTGTV